MRNPGEILDSLDKPRLTVVETGCVNTRAIATWIRQHPESKFTNVDLNSSLQLAMHKELECDGNAKYCTFRTQDHNKFLGEQTWVDAVFLNAPDLQSGLVEFLLAVSTGAQIIVMNDYQTRSALAIRRARELGWEFISMGMLNILRRPE
jgi:tRNA A58 N-methylase Trm61